MDFQRRIGRVHGSIDVAISTLQSSFPPASGSLQRRPYRDLDELQSMFGVLRCAGKEIAGSCLMWFRGLKLRRRLSGWRGRIGNIYDGELGWSSTFMRVMEPAM